MEEYRCVYCDHLLGYEKGGRLFNRKKELVSETGMRGYCKKCNNLNVWSKTDIIPAEDIESVPAKVVPQAPVNPATPLYIVFEGSKIYHSVDHFEEKVEGGKIITDTTGYRLCKICDGFLNGAK